MGHTYTSLLSHCIFSTKDRLPLITPQIRDPLFAYLGGIVRSLHGVALIVGGVTEHVHILASFPPTIAMSDAMRLVKANSSKWVNEEWPKLGGFAWQTGYAAFSVSRSSVDVVTAYIAGQEEHHRTMTFQEELVAFLKRHGIAYDERYIWQ